MVIEDKDVISLLKSRILIFIKANFELIDNI